MSDGSIAAMPVMVGGTISNPSFTELVYVPSHNGACLNVYIPTNRFEYGLDKEPIVVAGTVALKLSNIPEGGRKLRGDVMRGAGSDEMEEPFKIRVDLQDEPTYEATTGKSSSAIIGASIAMAMIIPMISFSLLWD